MRRQHSFVLKYTITAKSSDAEYGTINGVSTYTTSVVPGTSVTLTATASDGCTFKQWSDKSGAVSTANPYTFKVSANTELTAEFEKSSSAKNKIYYTSSTGQVVTPYSTTAFGDATIQSNTYTDGQGVITFDKDVTSIGERAFYSCSGLTSITIPDSVTTIDRLAFCSCSGLTSITIPDSVTSIGEYAFQSCTGLTSVEIPDSVTSIGGYVFQSCKGLTSVTIGSGVTSIGSNVFLSCKSLTSITSKATKAPGIQSDTFRGVGAYYGTLYYPEGSDYSSWLNSLAYDYDWTGVEAKLVTYGYDPNMATTEGYVARIDGVDFPQQGVETRPFVKVEKVNLYAEGDDFEYWIINDEEIPNSEIDYELSEVTATIYVRFAQ